MNVRIEQQNLRFKILQEELNTLLTGHGLNAEVMFLTQTLSVTMKPRDGGESMALDLALNQDNATVSLFVPMALIQQLAAMGRSRGGLTQDVNGVSVSLQVDLRKHGRQAGKK